MSTKNNNFYPILDNPEAEAMIEQAIHNASAHPDTPLDGGFGYAFGEATLQELAMTDSKPANITGFHLPDVQLTDADLQVVPYAGDERPIPYARQHVDDFMLTKPA